jgi:hypothetical protein
MVLDGAPLEPHPGIAPDERPPGEPDPIGPFDRAAVVASRDDAITDMIKMHGACL